MVKLSRVIVLLGVVFLFGGIVGIGLLFMKDYRLINILEYLFCPNTTYRYNSRVREWNQVGYTQMDHSMFSIYYANKTKMMDRITTGFGEFYPYRDNCKIFKNSKGDCDESNVLYYKSKIIPEKEAMFSILNGNVVFNETIHSQFNLSLTKKEINCVGGDVYFIVYLR